MREEVVSDEVMKPHVIEYITEEVRRQGHDVLALDGIRRVGWMLNAWAIALSNNLRRDNLVLAKIEVLGATVEQHLNADGFRRCGVRVGLHVCPPAEEVVPRLTRLLKHIAAIAPLDFYREFEEIHPFVDGNGRTGKILLNALNGTLLNPVFPPQDFWGERIVNP